MIGAQLEHRGLVARGIEAQQAQGNTQFVVVVARCRPHLAPRPEHGGDHLLHRGLAIAAGQRHDGATEGAAPVDGQCDQCGAGIGHDQLRQCDSRIEAGHDGAGGAALERLREEGVAVHLATGTGHEQRASLQPPRIDADAGECAVRAVQAAAEPLRRCAETTPDHAAAPSQSCTTARSEKGSSRSANT
jgi:hypothetical protein